MNELSLPFPIFFRRHLRLWPGMVTISLSKCANASVAVGRFEGFQRVMLSTRGDKNCAFENFCGYSQTES